MRSKHPRQVLLLAVMLGAIACGPVSIDGGDGDAPPVQPFAVKAALLGMNPAPPKGMTAGGWPAKALYMARIWDMDLTWAHIEPTAPVNGVHTYKWAALDAMMNKINAADMRPMYVFYGTPPWAAPGCQPNYTGACTVYPKDPAHWSKFTRAVAARYARLRNSRGEGPAYEVWNEPNLGLGAPHVYWSGTDDQLFDLNKRAW